MGSSKISSRTRSGQSLIESCLVMGLVSLIFLGLFQLSRIFAANEILNYAAGRGARARTVGFNDFMVWKTVRLGAIANAGKMIEPVFVPAVPGWSTDTPAGLWSAWAGGMASVPASEQAAIEESRMPLYLGAEWYSMLPPVLDYEDWDTVDISGPVEDDLLGTVSVRARQDYPLKIPMHRAFYDDDSLSLEGRSVLENHHPLYLTGEGP